MKIYIEVRGGVVQSVFTATEIEDIEVEVVDYDNIEAGDEAPELPEERIYIY